MDYLKNKETTFTHLFGGASEPRKTTPRTHETILRRPGADPGEDVSARMQGLKLDDSGHEDIYIALMGLTGSGKSTFISHLVGSHVVVGHDLVSCTSEVSVYPYRFSDRTMVHLIDTPGFNDSNGNEFKVLEEIAAFLKRSCQLDIKLNGVIYLHRISDVRMDGASMNSLLMFKMLVGDHAYKNVILATTMWEAVSEAVGAMREQQLVSKSDFWGLMKKRGCQVMRHRNTKDSARKLVGFFVNEQKSKVVLEVQQELVHQGKDLIDTAAGQAFKGELAEMLDRNHAILMEEKAAMAAALKQRDKELAALIKETQESKKREIKKMQADFNNMRREMEQQLEERSRRQEKRIEELLAASLKRQQPQLAAALDDPQRRTQHTESYDRERRERANRQRRIVQLDAEARREGIRQERVIKSPQNAMKQNEVFGRVHMLYVDVEINGHRVKASIGSGANITIMSQACAEASGIMPLVDKRYAGVAHGVGTANIIGRVHSVQIKISTLFLPWGLSVMEDTFSDLLVGLDILNQYQVCIDLSKDKLVIQGVEIPFLGEADIPKELEEVL